MIDRQKIMWCLAEGEVCDDKNRELCDKKGQLYDDKNRQLLDIDAEKMMWSKTYRLGLVWFLCLMAYQHFLGYLMPNLFS